MRRLAPLAIMLATTGCLRRTEHKCADSGECGADGICEPAGYCSFVDTACDSGRRFGEFSGPSFANQCVDDTLPDVDAGVDSPPDSMSCPPSYVMLPGITTHVYRVINAGDDFATHKAACAADGANAYLAIPDDQAELTAILDAGGSGATHVTWVGIEDPNDNNMFVTVRGVPFDSSDPLWATGEPNDNPIGGGGSGNCVVATGIDDQLRDEGCNRNHDAVCECEP